LVLRSSLPSEEERNREKGVNILIRTRCRDIKKAR